MYIFAARRVFSKLVFSIMAVHSYISAFVLYGSYDRPATFLAYADLYCVLLFIINAKLRDREDVLNERLSQMLIATSVIFVLAAIAIGRFGVLYALVEFRPYILALFLVLGARAFYLKLTISWVGELLASFVVWEAIFILTNYVVKAHKLGIFGELNYDVQFLVISLVLHAKSVGLRHVTYALAAKTTTFLIYASALWSMQRRSLRIMAVLVIFTFSVLFFTGAVTIDMLVDSTQGLDRLFIAGRYIELIMEDTGSLATCGQLFCGGLFYDIPLSWYIETQRLSSSLNSVVPAVFHGHLLRNMFMLGIPLAVTVYVCLVRCLLRYHNMVPLIAWILASSISQSITHHPFVGLLLVLVLAKAFSASAEFSVKAGKGVAAVRAH